VLTGVSLGFAIAGWAATPEAANQLNIALFSPVFLLAGILYPLAGLPDLVRDVVVYVIPFTAVVEVFRGADGHRSPTTAANSSSGSAGSRSPSPSPRAPTASQTTAAGEPDLKLRFR
jgi:ABC-type multidrug transport system permease subunit